MFSVTTTIFSINPPPAFFVALIKAISQGTAERTQGMSGVNPLSSRSHAMLQIQLRGPNQQMAGR